MTFLCSYEDSSALRDPLKGPWGLQTTLWILLFMKKLTSSKRGCELMRKVRGRSVGLLPRVPEASASPFEGPAAPRAPADLQWPLCEVLHSSTWQTLPRLV